MEAKKIAESKNHRKANADLLLLDVFDKSAIETNCLKLMILIQAVDTHLTFYLMTRPTEDIYLMTELDHIKLPMPINELQGIYGYLDNLCDILFVFFKRMR